VQALPRLYPIIDRAALDARGLEVAACARELCAAGVRLVQYRDKTSAAGEMLQAAADIARAFGCGESLEQGLRPDEAHRALGRTDRKTTLILNDHPELAVRAGWSGVHVGHRDMPPAEARRLVGPGRLVGVSTHNDEQVIAADASEADYIAVGPVFATSTKSDAEPVIGLAGVRRARALTSKPLVAIGGITRQNARSVIDAGADSVAVIGALLVPGIRPGQVAEDFLKLLR
jgi:thiamine-phosphate pyrophosphorylase